MQPPLLISDSLVSCGIKENASFISTIYYKVLQTGKNTQVNREMLLCRIDILGIGDCRWSGNDCMCNNIIGQHNIQEGVTMTIEKY